MCGLIFLVVMSTNDFQISSVIIFGMNSGQIRLAKMFAGKLNFREQRLFSDSGELVTHWKKMSDDEHKMPYQLFLQKLSILN